MDYVKQNNITVEREMDYSNIVSSPTVSKPYGVDTLTQYSIYKDNVNNPMPYGDFMNICGPYWEEDWKTLWLNELYDWLNVFSIFVMGCFAISNIQLSKININIPKINWGGIADTGYGTIYVAPGLAMTASSVWSIDISGVPSILLEQITFAIANNGISGSPASGNGGEGEESLKPQNLLDELERSGVKYNPNDIVAVTKTVGGKLVWLENGNSRAGLSHILNHADEFATKGIRSNQLPEFIIKALREGTIVGYQGSGTGSNGFIVGANPVSLP